MNIYFPLYLRYGIKMGIASALAYTLSYLMGSQFALWAVVSAIVAMQLNVADSLHAGLQQISGTLLGALLGVALLVTVSQTPLLIVSAVFVVASVCGYLTRYSSVSSATAVASMVVLLAGSQHISTGTSDAVAFGLMRVVEIAIGVGSAFFISLILWPVRLIDTLRADLGLQFRESARLLDAMLVAFMSGEALSYKALAGIEGKIWNNHERLTKVKRHESILFHYEHSIMDIQVTMLDRTSESLRSMLEALNDYDEEQADPLIGPELRQLGDALMATLRHLGGDSPDAAAPDLVRGLTIGVGLVEQALARNRQDGATKDFNLHKVLQIFSFYQAMRLLAESLLIALDRLEAKAMERKKR